MKEEIYEIGKYYKIPCVQIVNDLSWAKIGEWVPIIGPKHEDTEIINFPAEHYHIDLRFITERAFERISHFSVVLHDVDTTTPHCGETPYIDRVYLRRRKCRRQNPIYPHGRAFWMNPLREKYAEARLKCLTCPHRGIKLSNQKPVHGHVVCPGHGLIWNVETGKQIDPETYYLLLHESR